jgi:hypothetical protein
LDKIFFHLFTLLDAILLATCAQRRSTGTIDHVGGGVVDFLSTKEPARPEDFRAYLPDLVEARGQSFTQQKGGKDPTAALALTRGNIDLSRHLIHALFF